MIEEVVNIDLRETVLYRTFMGLTETQINKLAHLVTSNLEKKGFVQSNSQISKIISEVIVGNFAQEKVIEAEARKMLDQLGNQLPDDVDRHKMFLMIKKKVAQEKKFVL